MSLDDFDVQAEVKEEPTLLEADFERFYHNVLPHLTGPQAVLLLTRVNTLELVPIADRDVTYGAEYDMTSEVEGLIQSVRAMRNSVMTEDGRMRTDVTPREMKDVVTATSSLMNLLMKSHEKLMDFDRHRALEQATIDILRGMGGEEIVTKFVENMEARLEAG
ncbi:MAG: hypothetical protein DRQ89_12445 [Epsilonproteobacteria bacterium]|nr:MAG: hypothetical protein DRQ89_12445 [Campylobacterota bacterium]